MPEFSVEFDRASFEALDHLALLARQDYNLGNSGDWFGEFRGGLYGFYARLYGVEEHYRNVHAWLPRVRIPRDTEYHLASILFQMDSALECLTFALNALGWAVSSTDFRDVTDARTLGKIKPRDLVGDSPIPGYEQLFPTIQREWQSESQLIARIGELHDVSKHRRTIFVGGNARSDPPKGFYEALGLSDDVAHQALFWPMAEIILRNEPKAPATHRTSQSHRQRELLEDLVSSFATLIRSSGTSALGDAQANVPLKVKTLRG